MSTLSLTSSDQHRFQVYATGDEKAERGLIVLQEIFGVNQHIRNTCERFAEQGFRVLSPALFDRQEKNVELGYTAEDVQAGLALRNGIAQDKTLLDIQACVDALGSRKIGIVGYCWGGSLSWLAACRLQGLKAASCWYGSQIAQNAQEQPRIPVQMHFGAQDHSIPASAIQTIKDAQKDVDIYVYEPAGHGFGCDHRPDFHEASYKLAQERTLAFFAEHLR
ncbi:dienelactone hydrolase family protein [Alcaligenes faecalis]|uniref:dienelactone hydrolase family protein n=1 Tax=Alcaligenes faecalis TaxID=511 RepID=UPI0034D5B62A